MGRVNDEEAADAIRYLMNLADQQGKPVVGVARVEGHGRPLFGLVVSMSGRREDVQEVLDLMQEKYPNAQVPNLPPKVNPRRGKRGDA